MFHNNRSQSLIFSDPFVCLTERMNADTNLTVTF